MSIIRQESLFDLQDLYDLSPTHRYDAILSAIDVDALCLQVNKTSWRGAPVELNYRAMIHSLIIRLVERIPTIKDLIKRLAKDIMFKLDCGFLLSDQTPSEAAYSRLVSKLENSEVLDGACASVVRQAAAEGFITDDAVAIDATHFEARDRSSRKKRPKPEPKKRGRKSKAEREQWLIEKAKQEAETPLYKQRIEVQLDRSLNELRAAVPLAPEWGVKKNSEGQNTFWFGYKGHLAVGTTSQYILQSLFSSGNLNDGKAAIPLLKGIDAYACLPGLRYALMDAGYDYEPIYKQVHQSGRRSVIAYNRRNEPKPEGFNTHFAPTCVREHDYRYDSYDAKYETLKYTRPTECRTCPLADEDLCQKVYKVKITSDLRKYTAPARGSNAWQALFRQRSAVERVNAYLKTFFQLNQVRYRTGRRAKVHFELVTLVYNASKLAADRINCRLSQVAA